MINNICFSLDPAISDDDEDDDMYVEKIWSKWILFFAYRRKNSEAFDKETRNDNIDITDVDASADLFGKWTRKWIYWKLKFVYL